MDFAFGLYRDFGFFINTLVFIGLTAACVAYQLLDAYGSRGALTFRAFWLASSLALIGLLTLTPVERGAGLGFPALQTSHIVTEVVTGHSSNLIWPDWHDPVANILMMVPLATALSLKWPGRRVVLVVSALSLCIECTQYFYGHGRTAQISDVILNSIGSAVGIGIATIGTSVAIRISRAKSARIQTH